MRFGRFNKINNQPCLLILPSKAFHDCFGVVLLFFGTCFGCARLITLHLPASPLPSPAPGSTLRVGIARSGIRTGIQTGIFVEYIQIFLAFSDSRLQILDVLVCSLIFCFFLGRAWTETLD